MRQRLWTAALLGALLPACGSGPETVNPAPLPRFEELGRCKDFDPLRKAHFGDLHVHTSLSLDANLQGNRLTPADAYRFARGEEVGVQPHDDSGMPLRRLRVDRPLDFAAITDHAEFLGTVYGCTTSGSAEYDSPVCSRFRNTPDNAFVSRNLQLAAQQDEAKPGAPGSEDGCEDSALAAW
jgi:hypothetical protein